MVAVVPGCMSFAVVGHIAIVGYLGTIVPRSATVLVLSMVVGSMTVVDCTGLYLHSFLQRCRLPLCSLLHSGPVDHICNTFLFLCLCSWLYFAMVVVLFLCSFLCTALLP